MAFVATRCRSSQIRATDIENDDEIIFITKYDTSVNKVNILINTALFIITSYEVLTAFLAWGTSLS